jgi:hypothetical protein
MTTLETLFHDYLRRKRCTSFRLLMTHGKILARLPILKYVELAQVHDAVSRMSVGGAIPLKVRFIIMHVQLKWIATQTRIVLGGILDLFSGQVMNAQLRRFWRNIRNKSIYLSVLGLRHILWYQVR